MRVPCPANAPESLSTPSDRAIDLKTAITMPPITPTSARPSLKNWGNAPWSIEFRPVAQEPPDRVDFAIVGAGFTGLSAAARLATLNPTGRVAVFEAEAIGTGSSGHTGGLALAETAAGDMSGLGDVLAGVSTIVQDLKLDCDLTLPGVWEVDHATSNPESPILWKDHPTELRIAKEVPGGMIDPGKMVSELARAATDRGAQIFENSRVEDIRIGDTQGLTVHGKKITADRVLIATNAMSLELGALTERAEPKFTMALATSPVAPGELQSLGLAPGKPFYTTDLPYLWGRLWEGNRIIFGCGLVHVKDWRELLTLDVRTGEAARLLQNLEVRVRAFHPALEKIEITHKWGGPILIVEGWQPVFAHHPESDHVIVLGAYSGHGVMLSTYLGAWAADAMSGRREIPEWNSGKLTMRPAPQDSAGPRP
jgi:glycine/D-amino acid oxidase-like deaminating enzyme